MAAAVREALHICADEPERRDALRALILHGERLLEPLGARLAGSQIVPLVLGEDARAMDVAKKVRAAGYDVRGIRPPTVPKGTARLRISLTLNASTVDVDGLAAALAKAL
jgi:8-amino-7-oxononanoate synthase